MAGDLVQLTLRPAPVALAALDDRFEAFHRENPQVFTALRALALRMVDAGVRQYGIAGLFEVLRYEHLIQTQGDGFKLNNSFRAFYARLLMEREPRLRGFFETRQQRYEAPESLQWG